MNTKRHTTEAKRRNSDENSLNQEHQDKTPGSNYAGPVRSKHLGVEKNGRIKVRIYSTLMLNSMKGRHILI